MKADDVKLKWQDRSVMKDPTNALQVLCESYTRTSKDMGLCKFDAWAYGIIVGWDDESYAELKPMHGWTDEEIEYNKLLHQNYRKAWNLFMSTADVL